MGKIVSREEFTDLNGDVKVTNARVDKIQNDNILMAVCQQKLADAMDALTKSVRVNMKLIWIIFGLYAVFEPMVKLGWIKLLAQLGFTGLIF